MSVHPFIESAPTTIFDGCQDPETIMIAFESGMIDRGKMIELLCEVEYKTSATWYLDDENTPIFDLDETEQIEGRWGQVETLFFIGELTQEEIDIINQARLQQ